MQFRGTDLVHKPLTSEFSINLAANNNWINAKYHQVAFRSIIRWGSDQSQPVIFNWNPWSNKSEWWSPEGDNPWNLLFSSRIEYFHVSKLLLCKCCCLGALILEWDVKKFFTFNFGKFGTWLVSWFLEHVTNPCCYFTENIYFLPHGSL